METSQRSENPGRGGGCDIPSRRHIRIDDVIPALIWPGRGSGARPAIISLHGAGGNKSDIEEETVESITREGATLVTVDAYLHGERAPAGFDIRDPEIFTRLLFVEIIQRTAQDLFAVLAYLTEHAQVDPDRIGLRGGSMGGYVALAAVGMGLPVQSVLSVAGGADYVNSFVQLPSEHTLDTSEEQAFQEISRQTDPLNHVARFPPRPVLQVHGELDPVSPIAGDRALYHALVPHYQDQPQRCLFLLHAGGHETPSALEVLGWNWLLDQVEGPAPHLLGGRARERGGSARSMAG